MVYMLLSFILVHRAPRWYSKNISLPIVISSLCVTFGIPYGEKRGLHLSSILLAILKPIEKLSLLI